MVVDLQGQLSQARTELRTLTKELEAARLEAQAAKHTPREYSIASQDHEGMVISELRARATRLQRDLSLKEQYLEEKEAFWELEMQRMESKLQERDAEVHHLRARAAQVDALSLPH